MRERIIKKGQDIASNGFKKTDSACHFNPGDVHAEDVKQQKSVLTGLSALGILGSINHLFFCHLTLFCETAS